MSVCVSVCARACLSGLCGFSGWQRKKILRHQVGKSDRSAASLCQKKERRRAARAKINTTKRIFMVGDGEKAVTVTAN